MVSELGLSMSVMSNHHPHNNHHHTHTHTHQDPHSPHSPLSATSSLSEHPHNRQTVEHMQTMSDRNSSDSTPDSSNTNNKPLLTDHKLIQNTDIADHHAMETEGQQEREREKDRETHTTDTDTLMTESRESRLQPSPPQTQVESQQSTEPSWELSASSSQATDSSLPPLSASSAFSSDVAHSQSHLSLSLSPIPSSSSELGDISPHKKKLTVEIPGANTPQHSKAAGVASPQTAPSTASPAVDSSSTSSALPVVVSSSASGRHDVWMTPSQAKAESKKLKGYRWVPVEATTSLSHSALSTAAASISTRVTEEKRQRKEKRFDDDLTPTASPSMSPTVTKPSTESAAARRKSTSSASSFTSSAQPAVQSPTAKTQSKKGPKKAKTSTKSSAADTSSMVSIDVPATDAVANQLEVMRALELRLQALKQQQALLQSGAAGGSTPGGGVKKRKNSLPSTSSTPTFAAPVKKQKTPTPFASPSLSYQQPSADHFVAPSLSAPASVSPVASPSPPAYYTSYPTPSSTATPGAGAATPTVVSKKGRSIKTPSHFTAVDPVSLPADLRRCRSLLDHLMGYKAAHGVFNTPVNYSDPTKEYFAPNYLEIIQGLPMDLGTIKQNLLAGAYPSVDAFAADVRLVWRNAMLYNPAAEWIHQVAKECSSVFEAELKRIAEVTEQARVKKEQKALAKLEKAASTSSHQHSLSHHHGHHHHHPHGAGVGAGGVPGPYDYVSENTEVLRQLMDRVEEVAAQVSNGRGASGASPSLHGRKSNAARPSLSRQSSSSSAAAAQQQLLTKPLAQREKQMLKDDIFKLPANKLGPVVEIISKNNNSVAQADDDEIEIDIDKLDVPTLRELQNYVKKALSVPRRKASSVGGPPATNKASPSQSSTPRTSPHSLQQPSPQRLQTPDRDAILQSPSLHHGGLAGSTSGFTAPASQPGRVKYDSDESSSDESDEENDTRPNKTAAVNAPSSTSTSHTSAAVPAAPAPAILPLDSSSMTEDDDDALASVNTSAWFDLKQLPTTETQQTTSATTDTLWTDFQHKDQEMKLKAKERADAEARRRADISREHAALAAQAEEQRQLMLQREQELKQQQLVEEAGRKELIEQQRQLDREQREREEAESKRAEQAYARQHELSALERLGHMK